MKKLDIVYEDKHLIAVNKEAGLLTIATENERDNTLFHQVISYEKKKNKSNKIFIVHRLDKDTSGIVVFAKSSLVKDRLQNNWEETKRFYTAVVEGKTDNDGVIKSWLRENANFVSYSSNKPDDGKLAITKYKKINESKSYSLLSIEILTGRKNQIRVHMKDINHPIIGDTKYGAKANPLRRMGLVANKLEFKHPITNEMLMLEVKVPKEFLNMFKANKLDTKEFKIKKAL